VTPGPLTLEDLERLDRKADEFYRLGLTHGGMADDVLRLNTECCRTGVVHVGDHMLGIDDEGRDRAGFEQTCRVEVTGSRHGRRLLCICTETGGAVGMHGFFQPRHCNTRQARANS